MVSYSTIFSTLYNFSTQNVISHQDKNYMQSYLPKIQTKFNDMSKNNSTLKEEIEELKDDLILLSTLKRDLDDSEKKNETLQKEDDILQKENYTLKKEKEKLIESNTSWEAIFSKESVIQQNYNELKENYNELKEKYDESREVIIKLQKQILELQNNDFVSNKKRKLNEAFYK